MMGENWRSANDRRACLVCGRDGGTTFVLAHETPVRVVRICEDCARAPEAADWLCGISVPCRRAACVTVGR